MKHKILIATLICLVLIVMGTANATGSEAGSKLLVQTGWLAAHLNDSNVVVLHVAPNRTSYDAGHISGARFLPLSDVAVTRNGIPNQLPTVDAMKIAFERVGVGDKSRVVIYGDMSGLFAARAYFALDYLGHGNHAALLDGGLEKWKAEHRGKHGCTRLQSRQLDGKGSSGAGCRSSRHEADRGRQQDHADRCPSTGRILGNKSR